MKAPSHYYFTLDDISDPYISMNIIKVINTDGIKPMSVLVSTNINATMKPRRVLFNSINANMNQKFSTMNCVIYNILLYTQWLGYVLFDILDAHR